MVKIIKFLTEGTNQMKLYTDNKGQWVGTQLDAKKALGKGNFKEVDVPTAKAQLLEFLNSYRVRPQSPQDLERDSVKFDMPQINKPSPFVKKHDWQTIRECAEEASLKDLGVAVAVIMNRIDEAAEKYEQ
jgi:hypothetical protein